MKRFLSILFLLLCLPMIGWGQIPAGGVTWNLQDTGNNTWQPRDTTAAYTLGPRANSTYAVGTSEYTASSSGAYVTASTAGLPTSTPNAAAAPQLYKWLLAPVSATDGQQVVSWIVQAGTQESTLASNAIGTLTLLQRVKESNSDAVVIRFRNSAGLLQLASYRMTGSSTATSTNASLGLKNSSGGSISVGTGLTNANGLRFLITSVISTSSGNMKIDITASVLDGSGNPVSASTVTTSATISSTSTWIWAGYPGFSGDGDGGAVPHYVQSMTVAPFSWSGPSFLSSASSTGGLTLDGYNRVNVYKGTSEAARPVVLALNRGAATTGNITLSATGVPTGVTLTYDVSGGVYPYTTTTPTALQTRQNGYATIYVVADNTATPGTYSVTLTALDAISSTSQNVTLTIGVYARSVASNTIKYVTWGDSHTFFTFKGDTNSTYQIGSSNSNPDLDTVKRLSDRTARLICGDSYTTVSSTGGVDTYTGNGFTLVAASGAGSGTNHLNWEYAATSYVALHGLLNYCVANNVQYIIARVPLQNDSASLGLLGQLTNATSGGVATNGAASGTVGDGIRSSIKAFLDIHCHVIADPIFAKNYNNDGSATPLTSTADVANAANVSSYNPHLKVWGNPSGKSVSITTTNGSASITVADAVGLWPGQVVTATGVPGGTTIANIPTPGMVYTACQISGTSSTITLPTGIAATLSTGMVVYCPAFAAGTTVSSINSGANTVTLSTNAIPANAQTGYSTTNSVQNTNGDGFTGILFVGPATVTLSATATASGTVTASIATQMVSTSGEEFRFYDTGLDKFAFAVYPGITTTGSQAAFNNSLEFTHLNDKGYKFAAYSMASNLITFMLTKASAIASVNALNITNGGTGTLSIGATQASYWSLSSWPVAFLDISQGSFSEVSDPSNAISISGSTVTGTAVGNATVNATISRSALATLNAVSSSNWPTNSYYTGTWTLNAGNGTITVSSSGSTQRYRRTFKGVRSGSRQSQ